MTLKDFSSRDMGVASHHESGANDQRGRLWDIIGHKQVERPLSTDRCKLAECLADVSHLCGLGGQLLTTLDLVPILEEVLAAVAALLGAELGAIRLLDRDRNDLNTVVSLGLSPAYLEAFGPVPVGVGACGLAVERGGPVIIEDIEADPRPGPGPMPCGSAGTGPPSASRWWARTGPS